MTGRKTAHNMGFGVIGAGHCYLHHKQHGSSCSGRTNIGEHFILSSSSAKHRHRFRADVFQIPQQRQALPVVCHNKPSMRTAFTFFILLLLTATSYGQLPKRAMKKMGQNPIIFLDSAQTGMNSLQNLNPFDISNIAVVKPKKAKKLLGDKGVDGAIYVTTVKAAKVIYWNYLSSKSDEYKQLFNSPQADTTAQYLLNGEALSDSAAPGSLFLINDKNFKTINIIDKADGKYLMDNVIPKRYIVVISAKRPKGLVKKKTTT